MFASKRGKNIVSIQLCAHLRRAGLDFLACIVADTCIFGAFAVPSSNVSRSQTVAQWGCQIVTKSGPALFQPNLTQIENQFEARCLLWRCSLLQPLSPWHQGSLCHIGQPIQLVNCNPYRWTQFYLIKLKSKLVNLTLKWSGKNGGWGGSGIRGWLERSTN